MNKVIKTILVFAILLICSVTVAHAATNDELYDYATKYFTIAGKQVKLTDENARKLEKFLAAHPVTEDQADQIISKIDEAAALMNAAGISDPEKLSQDKKQELLSIAQEAASIAGASITYDASSKSIAVYVDGVLFDKISTEESKSLVQTGSDYAYIVYTIAVVAVVAIASVAIYQKRKVVNA